MFRTTPHRQVALALALVALALTSAVAGVAVGQTDVSSDETTVSTSGTDAALTATNETTDDDISATIVSEGDRLVLHSAENQTIRIRTNATPGTELIIVAKAGGEFLKTGNVVVADDGTATTNFDFSDVAMGTEFQVSVRQAPDSETRGIVVNESATVHPNGAFHVTPSANYTIRGSTSEPTVTKLDVRIADTDSSFTANQTVSVGEDGTFVATFDLSSLDSDTEVVAEVGGIPRAVSALVVTEPSRSPKVIASVETPLNLTLHRTGETVQVHSAASQVIRGTTNLRPGTEIVVAAENAEPNAPDSFERTTTVTVEEDGTFAATLNFSRVEVGTEFAVTVERGIPLERVEGRVVNDSVEVQTVTTTETTDPGVPGFGILSTLGALVALAAGFALARRT